MPAPRYVFMTSSDDDDNSREILNDYDVTSSDFSPKKRKGGATSDGKKRRQNGSATTAGGKRHDVSNKREQSGRRYEIVNSKRHNAHVSHGDDDDDESDSSEDSDANISENKSVSGRRSVVKLSPETRRKKPPVHTHSDDVILQQHASPQQQRKQTNIISRKKSKSKSPAVQSPTSEGSVMGVAVSPGHALHADDSDVDFTSTADSRQQLVSPRDSAVVSPPENKPVTRSKRAQTQVAPFPLRSLSEFLGKL